MGAQTSVEDLRRGAEISDAPDLPEGFVFQSAADNPLAATAAIQDALGDGSSPEDEDIPFIDEPGDNEVILPGGLVVDGEVYKKARVRELNGEDEEILARAMNADNPSRYYHLILERGVTHIGPLETNGKLLNTLLLGDRSTLVLAVRRATFGDDLDLDIICSHCALEAKIRIHLDTEIEIRPLNWDVREQYQSVELRGGVEARVRLADGADQEFIYSLVNKTEADLNTELFLRCVESIDGENVQGNRKRIRSLGMADRKTLSDWLIDKQPGPQYDTIKHTCTACGKETPIGLTAADLFPQ